MGVVANIPVGNGPARTTVSSDGTRVYVANGGGGLTVLGTVSVINAITNTVQATITVGAGPDGIAINTAGTRVYVANHGDHSTSVIDTASNSVIATIPVGYTTVAVNPAGTRLYVPSTEGGKQLSIIDTGINSIIGSVALLFDSVGALSAAVNPSGSWRQRHRRRATEATHSSQGHRDCADPTGHVRPCYGDFEMRNSL
jgi:YVTN family beta-propeller protein